MAENVRKGGMEYSVGADLRDLEVGLKRLKTLLVEQEEAARGVGQTFTQQANVAVQAEKLLQQVVTQTAKKIESVEIEVARRVLIAQEEAARKKLAIEQRTAEAAIQGAQSEAKAKEQAAKDTARKLAEIEDGLSERIERLTLRRTEFEIAQAARRRREAARHIEETGGSAEDQTRLGQAAARAEELEVAEAKRQGFIQTAAALGAAAAALAVAVGVASKAFADFESVLNGVQSVSNATETEMEQVREMALRLGADTQFSARQAAEGFFELGKSGFTAAEQMAAMPGVLDLAAAGQIRIAQASEVAAGIVRGFGLAVADTAVVADQLAQAANSSAVDVSDMASAMKFVAPVARASNQTLSEMTGILAFLGNQQIKATDAGTDLSAMLLALQSPSTDARKKLAELKIAIQDTSGKMLPLTQIVEQFRAKTAKLTEIQKAATAEIVFGRENVKSFLALMSAAPGEVEKFVVAQDQSTGASRLMAEGLQRGLNFQLEQLRGSLETLSIQIGSDFAPTLTGLARAFTEAVNAVLKMPAPLRATLATATLLAMGLGGIVAALGVIVAVAPSVVKAFALIRVAAAATWATIIGPWGIAAAVLVGLGAAIAVVATKTGEWRDVSAASLATTRQQRDEIDRLVNRYDNLSRSATRTKEQEDERRKILEKLQSISPDFVSKIDAEGRAHDVNRDKIKAYNDELARTQSIKEEAVRKQIGEGERQQTEIATRAADAAERLSRAQTELARVGPERLSAQVKFQTVKNLPVPLSEDAIRVHVAGLERLREAWQNLENRYNDLMAEVHAAQRVMDQAQQEFGRVERDLAAKRGALAPALAPAPSGKRRTAGGAVTSPPQQGAAEQAAQARVRAALGTFERSFSPGPDSAVSQQAASAKVLKDTIDALSAVTKTSGLKQGSQAIESARAGISTVLERAAQHDLKVSEDLTKGEEGSLRKQREFLEARLKDQIFQGDQAIQARRALEAKLHEVRRQEAEHERETARESLKFRAESVLAQNRTTAQGLEEQLRLVADAGEIDLATRRDLGQRVLEQLAQFEAHEIRGKKGDLDRERDLLLTKRGLAGEFTQLTEAQQAERLAIEVAAAQRKEVVEREFQTRAVVRAQEFHRRLIETAQQAIQAQAAVQNRALAQAFNDPRLDLGARVRKAEAALSELRNLEIEAHNLRLADRGRRLADIDASTDDPARKVARRKQVLAESARLDADAARERVDRERQAEDKILSLAKETARQRVGLARNLVGAASSVATALTRKGGPELDDLFQAAVAGADLFVEHLDQVALGLADAKKEAVDFSRHVAQTADVSAPALRDAFMAIFDAFAKGSKEIEQGLKAAFNALAFGAQEAGKNFQAAVDILARGIAPLSAVADTAGEGLANLAKGGSRALQALGIGATQAGQTVDRGLKQAAGTAEATAKNLEATGQSGGAARSGLEAAGKGATQMAGGLAAVSAAVGGVILVLGILKLAWELYQRAQLEAIDKAKAKLDELHNGIEMARARVDALRQATEEAIGAFAEKLNIRRMLTEWLADDKATHRKMLLARDQEDISYYGREMKRLDISLDARMRLWKQHFGAIKDAQDRLNEEISSEFTKGFFKALKTSEVQAGDTRASLQEEVSRLEQEELAGLSPEEAAKKRGAIALRKGAVIQQELREKGHLLSPEDRATLIDELNATARDFGTAMSEYSQAAPTATEAVARLGEVSGTATDALKRLAAFIDQEIVGSQAVGEELGAGTFEREEAARKAVAKVKTARTFGELKEAKQEGEALGLQGEALEGFTRAVEDRTGEFDRRVLAFQAAVEKLGFMSQKLVKRGFEVLTQRGEFRPEEFENPEGLVFKAKEAGLQLEIDKYGADSLEVLGVQAMLALGLAQGGIVPHRRPGGRPRLSGAGTDTEPAMLTPGEIVVPKPFAEEFPALAAALRSGAFSAQRVSQLQQTTVHNQQHVEVEINLGGVTVREEADENRLVAKLKTELAREIRRQAG